MIKKIFLVNGLLFLFLISIAQQSIDETIEFQGVEKSYHLYIPSNYSSQTPSKLMVGLHPWNVNNWNGGIWRDTLIDFAEENNLILLCPDGGPDGQIDDPIDIDFTTALIDSMENWYSINTNKRFLIGFSWGAKTVYTYGLKNADKFAGFIPVGAAINGIGEIEDIIENGASKPFFIIHGSNDSPQSRFFPARNALQAVTECLSDTLMPGIGHTINFPGRNELLNEAFEYVDSNPCFGLSVNVIETHPISVLPNPVRNTLIFEGHQFDSDRQLIIYDVQGKMILYKSNSSANQIDVSDLRAGVYFLTINGDKIRYQGKFVKLD